MSGSEDEDLAAAWGAALEEEGPPGESAALEAEAEAVAQPARVLNQAEIDSLLGFEAGPSRNQAETGIERVIAAGLVQYERLPMLEIVYDRLVRLLTTTLRNFTSDNVEISIDGMTSQRFGDYLNSVPLPAMLAVFKAEPWDNYGLVVVDSSLIYSVVDVLLGGRRGTAAMRIEGRPYTTIERTLVERLISVVLGDMRAAFEPLSKVDFQFERLEVNPRFAAISRISNACVVTRMRVDMEDRGGKIEILMPYATLEPVRELLLQQFMGERFGRDSIWETHLAEELRQTDVSLDVVLDEQAMLLSQVLRLNVGDSITLSSPPGAPVQLRCGEIALFEAQLGRRENRLAVRIEEVRRRPALPAESRAESNA